MRSLSDRELVVASHNPGKVCEIEALLAPHGVRVSSAAKFNLSEPDETGTNFAANAKIKAFRTPQMNLKHNFSSYSIKGVVHTAIESVINLYRLVTLFQEHNTFELLIRFGQGTAHFVGNLL